MLMTLIRRELLDNLMTFRFAAAVFITLLLVVAMTAVLLKDYEQRLASYNTAVKTHQRQLQEGKTYSVAKLSVDRPPNPLSLFNIGLDKRLGNAIRVYHGFVPTLWDAEMHGSDNIFLNLFTSIDLVFIFELVLSFLALIFAYDAIAGEHERGTLRLTLTHPVGRGHILLAKYIGAMLCLLVPFLMSLLLTVILLTTSTAISLSFSDFLRISGIVFSSVAYLSVFYFIGLLISVIARRTSTALMLAMFVWGFLVLVYPSMARTIINLQEPPQTRTASAFNEIKQMWEEFDRERKQFFANNPGLGKDMSFLGIMRGGYTVEHVEEDSSILQYYYRIGLHVGKLKEKFEPQVPHIQNYYRFLGLQTISTAERAWLVRERALEDIFVRPANREKILLKLSPVGVYDAATQAWIGTDLDGICDFFTKARQYRQTVIDYFYDKEAFGDRKWFSADKGAVDWSALPQFSFQRSDVAINAKRALPDVCLLLMLNVALFIITFLIFVKSEV